MKRSLAQALLAVGLVAAACGGGGDGAATVALDEELPLDALLAAGDSGALDRTVAHQRYHEAIRVCMAERGFEYTAPELEAPDQLEIAASDPDRLLDYAAEHGYGITELLLPAGTGLTALRHELIPLEALSIDEFQISVDSIDDANARYIAGLTDEQYVAYYEALDGIHDPDLPATAWREGCFDVADQAAAADQPEWLDAAYAAMDALYADYEDRFASVEELWAACMRSHGYEGFATRADAPESIRFRLATLYDALPGLDATFPAEALVALHADELRLAAADARCSIDEYLPAQRAIDFEVQTRALREVGVIGEEA